MCMNILPACAYVHREHSLRSEDVGSPGRGDMNVCEALRGPWKLSPGPLQVQVLLTANSPALYSGFLIGILALLVTRLKTLHS